MTAIEVRTDRLLPPASNPRSEVGRWGMVIFLLNEATLFACLVASYFFLGVENRSWPPAGIEKPSLPLPLLMTLLLLSSSAVLVYAERGFEQGRRTRYRAGVVATVLLGVGFLLIQAREYHDTLQHTSPVQHAYSSVFFTITGLHGAHVVFGLLVLLWALLRDITGRLNVRNSLAVKNASLYWHFVDGVWLVILTSLYLSPRWY